LLVLTYFFDFCCLRRQLRKSLQLIHSTKQSLSEAKNRSASKYPTFKETRRYKVPEPNTSDPDIHTCPEPSMFNLHIHTCPEPSTSNPRVHTCTFNIHSHILSSTTRYSLVLSFLRFSQFLCILVCHLSDICRTLRLFHLPWFQQTNFL
jgi:hypothetical protein